MIAGIRAGRRRVMYGMLLKIKKNIEYILHMRPVKKYSVSDDQIIEKVKILIKRNSLGELS